MMREELLLRFSKSITKNLDKFELELLGTITCHYIDEVMMSTNRPETVSTPSDQSNDGGDIPQPQPIPNNILNTIINRIQSVENKVSNLALDMKTLHGLSRYYDNTNNQFYVLLLSK